MRLVRSGEERRGERVGLKTLSALARDWYGDRLHPAWRPRSAEASQRILEAHGLTGGFWRLVSSAGARGDRARAPRRRRR
jgi:hypothetical protein